MKNTVRCLEKKKKKSVKSTDFQGTRKLEVKLFESLSPCSQKWSCLINTFPANIKKISKPRTVEYPNDLAKEVCALFKELWWFWWNFHLQIWVVLDRRKCVSPKPVKKSLSAFCLSVSPSTEWNSQQFPNSVWRTCWKWNLTKFLAVNSHISKYYSALTQLEISAVPID